MEKDTRLDLLTEWVRQFDGFSGVCPVPVSVDARAHNHGDDIGIAAAQLVVDVATEILHVRVLETWEHR